MMREQIVNCLPSIIIILCFSCLGLTSRRYTVLIKEMLQCEDGGTNEVSFASTRLTKVSRNAVNYFSNYTLSIPMDDNLSLVSELQVWGNGGWRPAFFTLDTPHLCSGSKLLNPQWFHELIKNTGRDDCPIPPGTYQVTAYNVSFADFNVPMWETGKYRLFSKFYKGDVLVGCLGTVLVVSPNPRLPRRKLEI